MNVLTQPQPAINQIEPMFDILNFSDQDIIDGVLKKINKNKERLKQKFIN